MPPTARPSCTTMKAHENRTCSSRPCAMPRAAELTTVKPSEAMPVATAITGIEKS